VFLGTIATFLPEPRISRGDLPLGHKPASSFAGAARIEKGEVAVTGA